MATKRTLGLQPLVEGQLVGTAFSSVYLGKRSFKLLRLSLDCLLKARVLSVQWVVCPLRLARRVSLLARVLGGFTSSTLPLLRGGATLSGSGTVWETQAHTYDEVKLAEF
jgi:hypothetical protein